MLRPWPDNGVPSSSCTSSSWAVAALERPWPYSSTAWGTRCPSSTAPRTPSAGCPRTSTAVRSRASASTATPWSRPASTRPTLSSPCPTGTTRISSPHAWRGRASAWTTSSPGSTTPAGPMSTSAWASPQWPPCARRPTR